MSRPRSANLRQFAGRSRTSRGYSPGMAEAISGGNQRILLSVPTRSEPAAKQKKRPSRMTLRRERGLVSAYSPYASLKPILDLRYGRYTLPRIRFVYKQRL